VQVGFYGEMTVKVYHVTVTFVSSQLSFSSTMGSKALVLVCCGAALFAMVSLPLSLPSSSQKQIELLEDPSSWPQITEMLKTYRVEVHPPPPICCPASPGTPSCCHGSSGGGGGGGGNGGDLTAQVNMVGFTNHGFGFMDYNNVRQGQRHFTDENPQEKDMHKSSTLRAQHQHRANRQLAKVQKHLSREEKEVDALKGEVWALTSDVIPKMQKEMHELRKRLQGGSRRLRTK
jgi:hypothetical protein